MDIDVPPPSMVYLTPIYRRMLPPDLQGHFRDLDQFIRDLILSAHERLLIISPYLGPSGTASLRSVLAVAARRGAWIRLVTGGLDKHEDINRQALRVLVQGSEGRLIRSHLRILTSNVEPPALLHAKAVVADGKRGYLGSANMSGRALGENLEVGTALTGIQAQALEGLVAYLEGSGFLQERVDDALDPL